MEFECPWVCAIDFGFDSTVVAVRSRETGLTVVGTAGADGAPSAVFATSGDEIIAGELAVSELRDDPSSGIASPKHFLSSGGAASLRAENDDLVSTRALVSAVLRSAYERARALFAEPPDAVVLSHPAGWTELGPAVEELRAAAVEAGMDADRIETVPEPVAVLHHVMQSDDIDGVVAVLDIGAGTTDLAIAEVSAGRFDPFDVPLDALSVPVGMRIADRVLSDHLVDLIEDHNPDAAELVRTAMLDRAKRRELPDTPSELREALRWRKIAGDIAARAVEVKESSDTTTKSVPFARPIGTVVSVDADAVDNAFAAVVDPATELLGDAVDLDKVASVIVSGAATENPLVVDQLLARLSNTKVVAADRPKLAVALGALLHGRPLEVAPSLRSLDGRPIDPDHKPVGPRLRDVGASAVRADTIRWADLQSAISSWFGAYLATDDAVYAYVEASRQVVRIAGGGTEAPSVGPVHPLTLNLNGIESMHEDDGGLVVKARNGAYLIGQLAQVASDIDRIEAEDGDGRHWVSDGRVTLARRYEPDASIEISRIVGAVRLPSGELLCLEPDRVSVASARGHLGREATTAARPLSRLPTPHGEPISGLTKRVRAIAAVGDSLLASASDDNWVRVWNHETGELDAILKGHTNPVLSVASLGGDQIASSSGITIRIWDLNSHESTLTLTGHTDSVRSVAGIAHNRLASGSADTTIRIWDLDTRKCTTVLEDATGVVWTVAAIGPDRLASGSGDNTVRLWNLKTETCDAVLRGHSDSVLCVAALEGNLLASGSRDDTVRIWDLTTGKCRATLAGHTNSVWSIAALGDNLLASASGDHTVRIWDLDTGKCTAVLDDHAGPVWSVVALPGQLLASGSSDETIRFWNLAPTT